jgi:hypothetical protein
VAKNDDNVIDITLVEDEPQPPRTTGLFTGADGTYEAMKMGEVDEQPSLTLHQVRHPGRHR